MSKTVSVEQVKLAGQLLKREHETRLLLEKEAEDSKLEKKAMQLAFREVELGLAEPFKTHEEFLSKVAALMQEDLSVVEKALDRGYGGSRKHGELASEVGKEMNPFERWVRTGEME